jgi:DNA repair exonuclease SbcCD nuclease subunit
MKIAIINDTHFGARNDSPLFLQYFMSFFEKQFFPYCKKNDIKLVLHLGDLMDRRKYVNFQTLAEVRKRFIQWFEDNNVELHCILGNHDTFYKNTNEINSIRELFHEKYQSIYLYEKPRLLELDGFKIAMIPWINKENEKEFQTFIKSCPASVICGHFELNGYEVIQGINFEGGMDDSIFSCYEMVLSGHFHGKTSKKNVHYLGTQYQITFSDARQQKGFHVLDTETRELEFIENPEKMYHIIVYDDSKHDPMGDDFDYYKNSYVKVLVAKKKDPVKFDLWVDKMVQAGVINLNIVEEMIETSTDTVDVAQDTMSIINEEIDKLETVENKGKLKSLIHELYIESLSS